MAETYEVFFVRHGISCANIWSKRQSISDKVQLKANRYPDPELAQAGILRSQILSNNLKRKIREKWPDNKYVVCSSPLIRAWQTAYYMLPPETTDPYIHIIPGVAEFSKLEITADNKPLERNEQNEIVNKIDPNIVRCVKSDYRNYLRKHYSNNLNGLKDFINDFINEFKMTQDKTTLFKNNVDDTLHKDIISTKIKNDSLIEYRNRQHNNIDNLFKGIKPYDNKITYRFVIFSHSNYILENFKNDLQPKLKGKSTISNNDIIFVKFIGGKYSDLEYFDHGLNETDYGCPDGCRDNVIGSYCKKNPNDTSDYHKKAITDILGAINSGDLILTPPSSGGKQSEKRSGKQSEKRSEIRKTRKKSKRHSSKGSSRHSSRRFSRGSRPFKKYLALEVK